MVTQNRALARKHLDKALAPFRELAGGARPPKGWVRAIRDALGMTSRQLAAKMGLSQATIVALERSEKADTVTLRSLRQAAAALDCEFIYALVPRQSLDETVQAQARDKARAELARIHHTMRLEDQALLGADLEAELDRMAKTLLKGRASRIWEET